MKVNNLNVVDQQRTTQYSIPPEENLLPIFLGHADVQALRRLRSRWNLVSHDETIKRAIDERQSLKGLTLSKTGRNVNQGTVWLEKDLRKRLIKEASKLGIDTAEYIRGIIYSLNERLGQEEIADFERQKQLRNENRKIPVQLTLNKELREKLYKRFEKELNDKVLIEKMRRKKSPMNGTTVEDRLLQEVLNSYLLEYLNR